MSDLGDLIRQLAATSPTSPPARPAPRPTRDWWSDVLPPVGASSDLERIIALPRRQLPTGQALEDLISLYTERFKTPEGTMRLRGLQAIALAEAEAVGGLLGPIGVGEGKTLIGLLMPLVLKSRRAVMLVPAGLRDQVKRLLYGEYSKHWRLPTLANSDIAYPNTDPDSLLWVIGYSELQSPKQEKRELLATLQPDLVICDEAHSVARYTAARTKRFRHYFKTNPQTRLVALSGTLIARSVKDAADLSKLALRRGSPYPFDWRVQDEWSRVLDPSDRFSDAEREEAAGQLRRLVLEPASTLRAAFRRRVVETPGVVASSEQSISTSLLIRELKVKVPPEVLHALEQMADTWETPWGEVITDALSYWRYVRQLSCGLNYLRVWPRKEPEHIRKEWLEARSEWNREVRDFLTHRAKPGLDSPGLLQEAAESGRWAADNWHRWDKIRHQAKPSTTDVWLSDFLVQTAVKWGRTDTGVIWYEHGAFGAAVAQAGGFPLYDQGDSGIDDEDGSRTVVASISSCGEGKNLQQWSKQLICEFPSPAKEVEQLLGRLHRPGQKADVVETYVCLHTPALRDSFRKTLEVAKALHEIQGSQKLIFADKELSFSL